MLVRIRDPFCDDEISDGDDERLLVTTKRKRTAGDDMTSEQTLVDAALRSWRSSMDRASKFFDSLTQGELELEVAPARNRLIYIWGHLTAVNDAMLPLFGFGQRRYPELDDIFVSPIDHTLLQLPSGPELKQIWTELDLVLWAEFKKLSPSEWLQRHQSISSEDFIREPHRNRYASLLGRTAHLAYHYGQVVLANRGSRLDTSGNERLSADALQKASAKQWNETLGDNNQAYACHKE